jgi:hypothetical protein
MRQRQRWEDWINLILGAWLFLSPWILNYTVSQGAAWNAYILGIAIIVFTIIALSTPKPWEEWVNTALGVWLIISPWVVGFATQAAATWNAVILGIIVLAISLEATRPSRQPQVTA